jgi:DNA-binding response OmpR family regulator
MNSEATDSSKYKEILCIDEGGEICVLLTKMLDNKEFKISHAKDTAQASKYLKGRQPALVLIENNFFENAGIDYAAELKAKLPGTSVIMLSAEDGKIKEKARKAGVDAFLTKPFTKKQLLDSVVSLVNKGE